MRGWVKRRGEQWSILIDLGNVEGRRIRKRFTYDGRKSKTQAENYMYNELFPKYANAVNDSGIMTVADLVDAWLKAKRPYLKENTYSGYETNMRLHVLPYLGKIKLRSLNAMQIQSVYTKLAEHVAPNSLSDIHTQLKCALKQGVRWGLLVQSPCEGVIPPKRQRETHKKALTAEGCVSLLTAARQYPWLHDAMFISIYAGLRRGEIFGLMWQDINFDDGIMRIERQMNQKKQLIDLKTSSSRRTIVMSPTLMQFLQELRQRNAHDFVICKPNGDLYNPHSMNCTLYKMVSGRKVTPHELRHTHASLLARVGASPKDIQERLGHSSPQLGQEIYVHTYSEVQKELAISFDDILCHQNVTTPSQTGRYRVRKTLKRPATKPFPK